MGITHYVYWGISEFFLQPNLYKSTTSAGRIFIF